jgi:hypothetical protein
MGMAKRQQDLKDPGVRKRIEEYLREGEMLTANWGRGGLVRPIMPHEAEPTIDDLELSGRVLNALRSNYHDQWGGDVRKLPAPPLSWLRGIMAKPKMWRNLGHVGMKGYAEIKEALEGFDG